MQDMFTVVSEEYNLNTEPLTQLHQLSDCKKKFWIGYNGRYFHIDVEMNFIQLRSLQDEDNEMSWIFKKKKYQEARK